MFWSITDSISLQTEEAIAGKSLSINNYFVKPLLVVLAGKLSTISLFLVSLNNQFHRSRQMEHLLSGSGGVNF